MLLAVSAMLLAASLPGRDAGDYNQKTIDNIYKLDKIESAMQAFMASNGRRPCPADGQYDVNTQKFGLEAGTLTPNTAGECNGGDPIAPMGPDAATGYTYMGTIPTKTLGLPDDYAYDAWGRRFSYVVDKRATVNESCYRMYTTETSGAIAIQYKDTTGTIVDTEQSMYAFISHGADAHGAWPPQGSSVAGRMNRNSTDADTLKNAGVDASFTYNTTNYTNTKVKRDRTTTFDDLVYYHSDTRNTCCIGSACTLFNPNGFTLEGTNANDNTGMTVAMIDINGDGLDDMVVGAPNADPGGRVDAGAVYVTFGTRTIYTAALSGSSLSGTNGFVIQGAVAGDHLGSALAVGDMNGDGIQDLAIGATGASSSAGETDVVFGGLGTWPASMVVSSLAGSTGTNGTNGIRVLGTSANDLSGTSLAFGDVNNDNISDLIIGAPGRTTSVGAGYVVFGSKNTWTPAATVNLASLAGATGTNGTNGIRINGTTATTERTGTAVTSCDINGDGIEDVIIGAPNATYASHTNTGRTYVMFGKTSGWTSTFNVSAIAGTNGFSDTGTANDQLTGSALSCGDLNGDGIPDLAIGGPTTNTTGTANGSVWVHYGHTGTWPTTVDLGSLRYNVDGYRLDGAPGDHAGTAVAIGPDLNGDGVQDLVIGAPQKTPAARPLAGGGYLWFGTNTGMVSTNYLPTLLNGTNGVIINGAASNNAAGSSVAAGNLNGTAQGAVIIGAPNATVGTNANAGRSYLLQGTTPWAASIDLSTIP